MIRILLILSLVLFSSCSSLGEEISSFEECEEKGYPILESYPRQCRGPTGETFIEEVQDIKT